MTSSQNNIALQNEKGVSNKNIKAPVTVFLKNGTKLEGIMIYGDRFCICLQTKKHQQLIYKHAITNIFYSSQ